MLSARNSGLEPRSRLGRRLVLMLFAMLVLVAVSLGDAAAETDELMLGLGARAMAFPGSPSGEARSLTINGVELLFRSQVVEAELGDVLSHYVDACVEANEGESPLAPFIASAASRRAESPDQGYVACVDLKTTDLDGLARSAIRFASSWDLSELGAFRYAYARRSSQDEEKTFVLTVWSDGSLNLAKLLPRPTGDADGTGVEGVPAPRPSRRILSVHEELRPSRVVVYSVPGLVAEELSRSYRAHFVAHGWALVERDKDEALQVEGKQLVAAEREGRLVTVVAHPAGQRSTNLTILESEAP